MYLWMCRSGYWAVSFFFVLNLVGLVDSGSGSKQSRQQTGTCHMHGYFTDVIICQDINRTSNQTNSEKERLGLESKANLKGYILFFDILLLLVRSLSLSLSRMPVNLGIPNCHRAKVAVCKVSRALCLIKSL
jgi:hypothetical protein